MRARLTSVMICALMLTSCASGTSGKSGKVVFDLAKGFTTTIPVHTQEIIDIGIYPLGNITGDGVRLISASFADAPRQVRTLNVHAYNYRHTKDVPLGDVGDLPKECPKQYVPHAIDSFVTPPHSDTPWFLVIAFTISRPGRYYLGRLRLRYKTAGHAGWQYQNINATIVVKNPPRPGPRPDPRSSVCG